MADVGRLAGVSHQTVSRVLNNHPNVRPETRARVLHAMRELDYRPNLAARALVTGRSATLGVVALDSPQFGPVSTLFAIERAAHAADHFVSIVSLGDPDRELVADAVDRLRHQGIAGIVVLAPQILLAEAFDRAVAVPLVAIAGRVGAEVPVVESAQFDGAAQATRHLLDLGHRAVFHLAGPPGWVEAQQRIDGWSDTLRRAGLAAPPPLTGDWTARSGYERAKELLAEPDFTALFAANDQMALGALRALREEGRDVPGDVSVVGFDDMGESAYLTPPLTTVRQHFDEVGRRSVRLLLGLMDGTTAESARETVPVALVVRASTAPPPPR